MPGRLGQYQVLDHELHVDHAAGAVLEVEQLAAHGVGGAHALAHGNDFGAQRRCVARSGDDRLAHGVEALAQLHVRGRLARGWREVGTAEHEARARHGLVFPGPGGIAAALLLVVGVGVEAGHQQARVAVGTQRGVDLEQVSLAGLDGEPVDELAHEGRVCLGRALVVIVEDEDDVQVAAIAQFLAAQLAVADDAELWRLPMAVPEPGPAPLGRDAQNAVGQGAQVVGHLLHGDAAFDVARQRAEDFGMVGAAQQVQQGFVVVLARGLQRGQAQAQLALEVGGDEALAQHGIARQFVDHAGVLLQIAGGPARRAQQVEQAFMHGGPLQQQG